MLSTSQESPGGWRTSAVGEAAHLIGLLREELRAVVSTREGAEEPPGHEAEHCGAGGSDLVQEASMCRCVNQPGPEQG